MGSTMVSQGKTKWKIKDSEFLACCVSMPFRKTSSIAVEIIIASSVVHTVLYVIKCRVCPAVLLVKHDCIKVIIRCASQS